MALTDRLTSERGRASHVAIREALSRRGRRLAGTYAPDGQFHEPAEDIGEIILEEARGTYGEEYELNADGMSVQINEETAGLQSAFWLERNNPGGIGAVDNNPGLALRFPTQRAGIHAHAAHLRNYAFGRGPWSKDDPRTDAMASEENRRRSRPDKYPGDTWRMFGAVRTFADLEGRWATSQTYTESLESIWSELERILGENMTAQIPGFIWYPAASTHFTPGRTMAIVGGAQHYSDGKNSLGWLTKDSGRDDPRNRVSATFLIKHNPTMEDRGWQLVRIEDTAWTTGSIVNPKTVSSEYEHDGEESIPDIAYDVMAETWKDVANYVLDNMLGTFDILKGHNEWVEQPDRICPDGIDMTRLIQNWKTRMGQGIDQRTVFKSIPDPFGSPYGLFWTDERFLKEQKTDFMRYGHVVSGAFTEWSMERGDTLLVQYFERGRMEMDKDGNLSFGLVGREVLWNRYPDRRPI